MKTEKDILEIIGGLDEQLKFNDIKQDTAKTKLEIIHAMNEHEYLRQQKALLDWVLS